jgi:hypothetical protein
LGLLCRLGCELCLDLGLLPVESLLCAPVLLGFFRRSFGLPALLVFNLLLQVHLVLGAGYVRIRTRRVAAAATFHRCWRFGLPSQLRLWLWLWLRLWLWRRWM